MCFVVAEKKEQTGCFQSKNADEEACVAVKIEHSRGRQHHLYSPHSHRSAFLAQKAALGGRDNKCIHSLLVRRCEEVVRLVLSLSVFMLVLMESIFCTSS